MKKFIWLFLIMLFVPTFVFAKEKDAIEQINDYKLERETNLIESTNDVASMPLAIPSEDIKAEDRFLNINNLGYILLIIPIIGSLTMYTLIIKAKEAEI